MSSKIALITGITGQDGAYLAEFLLKKGYIVHGVKRRASLFNTDRIDHLYQDPHVEHRNFILHYGDLTDSTNLIRIIQQVQPDEIYNLAAMSHVAVSFETPEYTANADGLGTLRILEAIRILGLEKKTRFYQASTSELYGLVQEIPQKETTPFYPRSPYAVAKLYGYWITVNYREAYGMYACNGILFNHESPIRGETFVTRKITRAVARISLGLQDCLYLGNMDALRDWGHARDYVEMQWLMLQQEQPEDFVIATGVQFSVRQMVEEAAKNRRHPAALGRGGEGGGRDRRRRSGPRTEDRGRSADPGLKIQNSKLTVGDVSRQGRSPLLPADRSRDPARRSRPRRRKNSAGRRRPPSRNWCGRWCCRTWKTRSGTNSAGGMGSIRSTTMNKSIYSQGCTGYTG